MGIGDDDRVDYADDGPDKIPTHHLEFCLLGFIPATYIIIYYILLPYYYYIIIIEL